LSEISEINDRIRRRQFLKSVFKTSIAASFAFASGSAWSSSIINAISESLSNNTTGPIILRGANYGLGHRLLHTNFPSPSKTIHTDVIIIGSGIAGLAAARHLYQNNHKNFIIVELEKTLGGNSSWGENELSKFPWGGHYLPIPNPDLKFIIDFLLECNVISGFNTKNLPIYNELYLCHDLKERLYINGKWQEGLIPSYGVPKKDREQITRFFELMEHYKYLQDGEGRYAFNIPVDLSAKLNNILLLDTITMKQFMQEQGFDSSYLYWYVNYCCRDDYGVGLESVSAWAGVHYFAARRAKAANAESDAVLTWPEGNGFLAKNLANAFTDNIKTELLAYEVGKNDRKQSADEYYVNCFSGKDNTTLKIIAKSVILACPRFIASHMAHSNSLSSFAQFSFAKVKEMSYSPWLVANISVKFVPSTRGADLAWDNVSYYSHSLGYIDAKHQSLNTMRGPTVLTYYLPMDQDKSDITRKNALSKKVEEWRTFILQDLENMHPGISQVVEHIDLWIWGHGMIRPIPNFIWSEFRQSLPRSVEGIFFAHSDMSGISIFEEAFWQGITTAKSVLAFMSEK